LNVSEEASKRFDVVGFAGKMQTQMTTESREAVSFLTMTPAWLIVSLSVFQSSISIQQNVVYKEEKSRLVD